MYDNRFTFRLQGRNALFSDSSLRLGGEKTSLLIPTYQALKGIAESIYWKPCLIYYVDRIKVLNPILTETKGIRPLNYGGGNDLSYYTYLRDVDYLVEVHFEFNISRPELKADWNENKHFSIAKRSLARGGRRDIFLGTRECQAYVTPADFDSVKGYYSGVMDLGFQYHSLVYADENFDNLRHVKFWYPKMIDSIVTFCRPEECPVERLLSGNTIQRFEIGTNMSGVNETEEEVL